MNGAWIIWLMIGCAGLMSAADAAPSDHVFQSSLSVSAGHDNEQSGSGGKSTGSEAGNQVIGRGISEKGQASQDRDETSSRKGVLRITASRPQSVTKNARGLATGNSVAHRQAKASTLSEVTNRESAQTSGLGGSVPRHVPTAVSRVEPARSSLTHHGPNPASVGGSANSSAGNTAAINGSRIRRRP